MREWLMSALGRAAGPAPAAPEAAARPAPAEIAAAELKRGNALLDEGKLEEALFAYRASVAAHETASGLVNIGFVLKGLRRGIEAAQAFERALLLDPGQFDAAYLLGELAAEEGDWPLALAYFTRAREISPGPGPALAGLFTAHNELGNTMLARGSNAEAAAHYRAAIALQDGHAVAHANLGLALLAMDDAAGAQASIRRAVALSPGYARGHHNLGNVYSHGERWAMAIEAYGQALALDPQLVQAHYNLAIALSAHGRPHDAIASWRRTLALDPACFDAWIGILYQLGHAPDCPPDQYLQEARGFGAACAANARPYSQWNTPLAPLRPGQPLRVGFVSGDMRAHPVGYFLEAALENVDPASLTLVAYTTNPIEDTVTARLKPLFAQWRSIFGMSDEAAASAIHADGVHLLIDLAGVLALNRLPLFAWRPAPVQATWLGYYATTGVPGIDYFIADPVGVPPAHAADFSEAVRYLPDTRLCFTEPRGDNLPQPNALPALGNGYPTLGCFQNAVKLNDGVLTLWGEVFRALPHARLRHQSQQMDDEAQRELLLARLERHGIARERVELAGATDRVQYFIAHHRVDAMLDTFPYCGGTTTCEALWMGVPTLTLAGRTLIARQGASLLTAAGLADWVAEDGAAYVALLVRHCNDLPALAALRLGLREKVLASPLFDGKRFAGNLQVLLHSMWLEKSKK